MGKDEILRKFRERAIAGINRYAASDKSDPFTRARAITHLNAGIVAYAADGKECLYNADEYQEPRSYEIDGRLVEYTVPAFRNVQRP